MNELTPHTAAGTALCRCESGRIPEAERQKARRRMLDVLGCALGGAKPRKPGAAGAAAAKRGPAKATVWAHGGALAMEDAALINSVSCRSYDFEVMTPPTCTPASCPQPWPWARPMAEVWHRCWTRWCWPPTCARVAEASAWTRPRGSILPVPQLCWGGHRRRPPDGTGRAPAAVRLWPQPGNMMCGSFENMWAGSTSFKFNQGWAAWCGIFSAKLALIGWTAPTDPLQGRAGYYALYTSGGCSGLNI